MNTNMNMNPSPTKKNNKTLIIVGVIVGICLVLVLAAVLAVGAVGRLVSRAMSTDPTVVAETAQKIADFDLPPGYAEQMAINVSTYQIVMIAPVDNSGSPVIMLEQFANSNLSPEEMERQLNQVNNQPGISSVGQFHVVETRTMTIRGYDAQVVTSEASFQNNLVMRRLTAVFPGRAGQVMLMIQGVTDSWDEQVIDDFIKSIR
jgi:hypothetical protein